MCLSPSGGPLGWPPDGLFSCRDPGIGLLWNESQDPQVWPKESALGSERVASSVAPWNTASIESCWSQEKVPPCPRMQLLCQIRVRRRDATLLQSLLRLLQGWTDHITGPGEALTWLQRLKPVQEGKEYRAIIWLSRAVFFWIPGASPHPDPQESLEAGAPGGEKARENILFHDLPGWYELKSLLKHLVTFLWWSQLPCVPCRVLAHFKAQQRMDCLNHWSGKTTPYQMGGADGWYLLCCAVLSIVSVNFDFWRNTSAATDCTPPQEGFSKGLDLANKI